MPSKKTKYIIFLQIDNVIANRVLDCMFPLCLLQFGLEPLESCHISNILSLQRELPAVI